MVLTMTDVRAGYGAYKALNGLTFAAASGEAVAVLGRNGAGKSTLARVASALVPIRSGTVELLGRQLSRSSPSHVAGWGVVHLPEGVGLFSGLTIEENLSLRVGGSTAAQRRERLQRALDGLGPLSDRRREKAGQLSGGQQRLVAVHGALAAEPKLLLADEPALGLSPAAADDIYESLAELRGTSTAVVIIETRLGRVEKVCTRSVVLDAGAAVYDGPVGGAGAVLEHLLVPHDSTQVASSSH